MHNRHLMSLPPLLNIHREDPAHMLASQHAQTEVALDDRPRRRPTQLPPSIWLVLHCGGTTPLLGRPRRSYLVLQVQHRLGPRICTPPWSATATITIDSAGTRNRSHHNRMRNRGTPSAQL
jgi:hypothetical protein